jgi:hypothetical protein
MAITKILNIQEADNGNPAAHLKNAVEYIQNPDKTEKCVLVGGINCLPDSAYEQMIDTKNTFHKTNKRQGYHVIISFPPEENVTADQAMEVIENFANEVLGDDYEAVYAVHTDKEHMHAHLIWNSVSLVTGQKYNSPKGNWKNKLQPITNKYCEKLGLTICPAEYSKNPVNMTRDEWQKEQDFKEFILRDAKFCALSAGSVEHFEFLMKRLGYEFQSGAYMRVRIPGRKIYHRLDKMDEMFEEGKLKYYVGMPWSANPYFYSQKPSRLYHNGMTAYQKKYYTKMYRMRVIEHKRFDYSSARYAEELRKFHRLQDEYLLLVNNDIRDLYGLVSYMEGRKQDIERIDDRQHEIYKENQSRKRKIVTPEDMREYQMWHLSIEPELAKLKEQKKKVKQDYKLANDVLQEKTYSVQVPGIEEEVVTDVNEVVMPEYEKSDYNEPEILQETPQEEVAEKRAEREIPATFEEYHSLPIESRLHLQGIPADINAADIFRIVKENFDKTRYAADFDELYEETVAIQKCLKAQQYSGSVDEIVRKLQKYGSYDRVPLSVKVDVFSFGFNNVSENLDIYMKVLKQLGVRMAQSEMFEDYQAIYEENVKRQEREEDKRWNKDKIR